MRPGVLFIAVDDFATRIRGCGDPGAQPYAVAKIFVTYQKSRHSSLITVVSTPRGRKVAQPERFVPQVCPVSADVDQHNSSGLRGQAGTTAEDSGHR